MNRWREALTRFDGQVPAPFAIYRAPILGGGSMFPDVFGICSYQLKDLNALRSVEELSTYQAEVKDRIKELDAQFAGLPFDDDARDEYASLKESVGDIDGRITELTARKKDLEDLFASGKSERVEPPTRFASPSAGARSKLPEDLTDLSEYRARTSSQEAMVALMRDGAKKLAETVVYPHERATPERTTAHIHKLLEKVDGGDDAEGIQAGTLARRILATGSPLYGRAFGKAISGIGLTPQEQAAINTVGTTTAGGFAVPFQLDPTVILTSDGATNPLRAISRIEQIIGNTWKGVTSQGITITRGPAESQPVTASAVVLGQPELTVQPVKAEVKFSIEAGEDWPRLQSEVARIFQDAKDTEEADSFVQGTGLTVFPAGIASTLDASSLVPTADTSNPIALALADLFTLRGALPPRFRAGARYLAADSIFGLIRQLGSGTVGDASIWTYGLQDGDPDRLLGKPAHEASAMADDMTAENIIAIYGNFQYFLIAEKIGMTVELDPHVRDGDGKWTGERALLMHYRNSSLILADNAFRALVAGAVPS